MGYLFLILYVFGLIVFPLTVGYLNKHYKWVTQKDFGPADDVVGLIGIFVVTCILWPLAALIGVFVAIGFYFKKTFIPKD